MELRTKRALTLALTGALVLAAFVAVLWLLGRFTSESIVAFRTASEFASPSLDDVVIRAFGLGFIATAIIQVTRNLYPLRGLFHRWVIGKWLAEGATSGKGSQGSVNELILMTSKLDRGTFLDLPIEQVCGQISAAVDDLIDDIGSPREDVRKYEHLLASIVADAVITTEFALSSVQDRAGRRNDLAALARRRIDMLQIWASTWWRRTLRLIAVVLCTWMAWALTWQPNLFSSDSDSSDWYARLLFAITHGILGGFLATVIRDAIAVVEKIRR